MGNQKNILKTRKKTNRYTPGFASSGLLANLELMLLLNFCNKLKFCIPNLPERKSETGFIS